ncbi:MAG TPA: 3-deoxy-7-phosphoheptulonate synthase [Verrucomicrobia bacterium]|nr:MAG: 3-deoxy-7-phosphoheptulonate synthase [Lentisphaerae bacterium GWF2_57_35]HBA86236.1 3-deoxy-7-phosphoheptulonate synthase [Verrucomicrobiota bacterium]
MIIVLKRDVSDAQIQHIMDSVRGWNLTPNLSRGTERSIIGVIGDEAAVRVKPLEAFAGVESVMPVLKPYKLASADFHADRTQITIPPVRSGDKPVTIGGPEIVVMAGPCAVENREMLLELAAFLKENGATMLRGGAFKPRSSPYAFQGLGVEGLRYLAEERTVIGLPVITEVMDTRDVEMVAEVADVLQVGARNMQNFNLLKAIGRCEKPVMIKRGLSSTLEELLMSAEYVLSEGNPNVILCERGIRTFEKFTRNTLDLSAVPVLKRESHLPVVVDPSHGVGHWDLVIPMARAAVAAGADGLMIEVHPKPEEAFSDGPQTLIPRNFRNMMKDVERIAKAMGRSV